MKPYSNDVMEAYGHFAQLLRKHAPPHMSEGMIVVLEGLMDLAYVEGAMHGTKDMKNLFDNLSAAAKGRKDEPQA